MINGLMKNNKKIIKHMKKHISLLVLVFAAAMTISSCSTEKSVIRDLRSLNSDLQSNGDKYTTSEWKEFAGKYKKVLEKTQKCDFNNEQREEVAELHTQIATGMAQKASASFLDKGITWGSAITSVLKNLTKSLGSSVQEILEFLQNLDFDDDEE